MATDNNNKQPDAEETQKPKTRRTTKKPTTRKTTTKKTTSPRKTTKKAEPTPEPPPQPTAVEKDPTKDDFRIFLFLIWQFLGLPEPTRIQYDMADYLQGTEKRGINRCMIEAFRGLGKSFVTMAYVVWRLHRNPDLRIKVISATATKAEDNARFAYNLIHQVPWLAHLKPPAGKKNSVTAFEVGGASIDQSPSLASVSISGTLVGGRADLILADDIESPKNSTTVTAREKLLEQVKEFAALLKPDRILTNGNEQKSQIIYLGTPQSQQSIYNQLHDRGYEFRIWPAVVPNDDEHKGYISPQGVDCLAPIVQRMKSEGKIGAAVDPQRFDLEDLFGRKLEYGKAGFQLQFMLNCALSDADKFPLKLNDLIVYPVNKLKCHEVIERGFGTDKRMDYLLGYQGDFLHEYMWANGDMVEYTKKVLAVDPSGRGADHTVAVVGYFHAGRIFVPAKGVRSFAGGYEEETLIEIAKMAKEHDVHEVITESNFGDGMFNKLFEPILMKHHKCILDEVRHHTQKERRIIDTLEPIMAKHQLIIDPEVIESDYRLSVSESDRGGSKQQYSLFYQMTRLSADRGCLAHDDAVDTLAIMVARFVEFMNQTDQMMQERRNEELLQREFDAWESAVGGCFDDEWGGSYSMTLH